MDAVFTSIIDIIKLKLYDYIDTGDKKMDTMVYGFVTTLITLCFASVIRFSCKDLIREAKRKYYYSTTNPVITVIPSANSEKYKCIYNKSEHYAVSFDRIITITLIINWYNSIRLSKCQHILIIDFENTGLENISGNSYSSYTDLYNEPVLKINDSVLYIHFDNNRVIMYSPDEIEFKIGCDYIFSVINKMQKIEVEANKPVVRKIYEWNNQGIACVLSALSNTSFNDLISEKKPLIINTLDKFIKGNSFTHIKKTKNLGIVLHGKPGTGKTSFIKAICNYLNRDAYMVDLAGVNKHILYTKIFNPIHVKDYVYVFDEFDRLLDIANDPKSCDKDTVIAELKEKLTIEEDDTVKQVLMNELTSIIKGDGIKVTVETLLTLFDGLVEHEGRVIVATTNFPDKIPPELMRPGRFDLKVELDYFTKEETVELLIKIFELEDQQIIKGLERADIPDKRWSPADIINIVMKEEDLDKVVDRLINSMPDVNFKFM